MNNWRVKLKNALRVLVEFGKIQIRNSVFAGYILLLILIFFGFKIERVYGIHRFDILLIFAILAQILLIKFKVETKRELGVIMIFHILAMIMEVFKTSNAIGSWHYEEGFRFGIGNVPLFAGFMYSAVGSYLVNAWKNFKFVFEGKQLNPKTCLSFGAIIYLQFFTHHYIWDLHYLLIAISFWVYGRTRVLIKLKDKYYKWNLWFGMAMVALFIYLAENIGTYFRTWSYSNQTISWHRVHYGKIVSWFLLIQLSFSLVSALKLGFRGNLAQSKKAKIV